LGVDGGLGRLQVARDLLPPSPRHVLEAEPDQMDDARLHDRRWEDRLDRLREAFQPVGEDVPDAALLELGEDMYPELRANGRWIAFLDDTAPNAVGTDPINLYVMRPDGGNRHPLAINVDGWSFSWSPDNTEIAVGGGRGDRVVHVSVNAAKPIRLADGPRTVITDIVWSPDGSKIAYARGPIVVNNCFCDADGSDVEPRHLWVLDLHNRERRLRLVINSGSVDSFATTNTWLKRPGSPIAVFDGDRIRLVGLDGHNQGSLKTVNWGQLSAGSASPDGRKLLLVDGPSNSYDSAIFIARIHAQSVRQLTQEDKQ
jgi:Tol biopolymer transport system component